MEQKLNGDKREINDNTGQLSPNFTFKLIMLVIFLGFTIYFLYLLIKILTR
jgi:hypothetical protein